MNTLLLFKSTKHISLYFLYISFYGNNGDDKDDYDISDALFLFFIDDNAVCIVYYRLSVV